MKHVHPKPSVTREAPHTYAFGRLVCGRPPAGGQDRGLPAKWHRPCPYAVPALVIALILCHIQVDQAWSTEEFQLPSIDKVVERVKGVYTTHCCFTASFDQVTVNVAMDLTDRFRGKMYVKKPSLIALEVQWPERQKVVIKGRTYTVHFPEDGNTTSGEIPPEMNVEHFFGFFASIGQIDRNFTVSFPAKSYSLPEQLIFVELADKHRRAGTYRILLGIDFNDYTIRRAVIHDALGNYNRFDLSRITFSDSLPDSRFRIGYGSPGGLKPLLK